MTWIRWECDAVHDPLFGQLAERLRIPYMQAYGHYLALCGFYARHNRGLPVTTVTDISIEGWADWRGRKGMFAAAVRGLCLTRGGHLRLLYRRRPDIPAALRRQVLAESGGRCATCGATDHRLEVDHIVPLSAGGPTERKNLQALCKACNLEKSDSVPALRIAR